MQKSNNFHCCNIVWLTNMILVSSTVHHTLAPKSSFSAPNNSGNCYWIAWPRLPHPASAAAAAVMQWLLVGWRARDEPNITVWPRERGAPRPLLSAPPHGPAPHQACPQCPTAQQGQHREDGESQMTTSKHSTHVCPSSCSHRFTALSMRLL